MNSHVIRFRFQHLLFQIRWVSWQRSPCSILEVIGSHLATQDIQVVDNFGLDLPLMFKVHKIWSVDTQENSSNCCHQMSDFKAKMHHIRFRLLPQPKSLLCWGCKLAYSAPQNPYLDIRGLLLRVGEGREEKGMEGRGRGKGQGEGAGGCIQVLRGDRRPCNGQCTNHRIAV